ncbi:hypothetical protein CAFEA_10890 [Corynebacterium afermentans subsp. afermentans]|uniref:Secreted protein n=1 Tax=Corynebacterium afermentans TaxID=38286 RepID=A0A9X8R5M6_9CORY|nr:hypothetical protein [Corynebacterium afermentans]OAA17414.1 hypothetical protein Caferm_02565 [Corynebacterium afermentans subsp. afermentans]RUQ11240.1 hypothetical protein D8M31_09915 [Corynebacterium genitalium]WJY57740.1 hypothetical protein CAFEA_10890 [Corynebacterium afermentans subsp. afermentans]SIQ49174.1 hypothetical protein SAMN05421802_11611 [Corynebacterium afermentans]
MKKFAAAALAATMTLPLGAVEAQAASNTMTNYNFGCRVVTPLGTDNTTPDEAEQFLANDPEKLANAVMTSSYLAEAFGSSDSAAIEGRETVNAYQACVDRKNYKTTPMTDGTKAGIIAGTVILGLLALGGAAWPFIQPMVQQYLPF